MGVKKNASCTVATPIVSSSTHGSVPKSESASYMWVKKKNASCTVATCKKATASYMRVKKALLIEWRRVYYQTFVDFVHFWSFFSQVFSFCNACVFVFEVHGVNVRFKREDTLVGRVSWTSFWNFVSTSRGSGVVQKGKERRGPECHACRTALYCTQFWR